jgi:LDH2 family malate/lactate/ureidoglycolate dehydrogenase
MAIDVRAFTSEESFRKTTGEILRQLRASRKAPGQSRIYTAGEKEHECFLSRKASGVPLNEALQETIKSVIAEYGVEGFDFSFLK